MRRYVEVAGHASLPCGEALRRFWEPAELRVFWPSIERFATQYDDGVHQEGIMHVERDGALEQLRVVRFRRALDIQFFNPKPPPAMASQDGTWSFEPDPAGGCVVRAKRWYELFRRQGETALEFSLRDAAFAQRLGVRLRRLLAAFAAQASQPRSSVAGRDVHPAGVPRAPPEKYP